MKDGLYVTKVHEYTQFYKIIDGKPYIPDKKKGKLEWSETIVEESRLKKCRPVSERELIEMVRETSA